MGTEIALPGEVTKTSLRLPEEMTVDQWQEVGVELKSAEGSLQWWLGDWWIYGEQAYGERAAAAGENGINFQTARNIASVCRSVETSRRRDVLSWSHHAEVAALKADAQDELLGLAVDNGWSRNQLRQAVKEWKEKKRQTPPDGMPEKRWSLIHSSVANLDLGDEPVDCIITDPPYPRQYLDCYSDLAERAAQVLRPGGSCVVMTGQSYLPEVIERLSGFLNYQWTSAYLTPGGQSVQVWDRKVNTFWKPLLWFVKGEYEGEKWLGDVMKSGAPDKDFHHWGQSESGMSDIVQKFTKAGETILDPFCGGGTTGVVAVQLDRLFIGSDVDAECLSTTENRLKEIDNAGG